MARSRRLLSSLLLVEEKLLEANYFVQLMREVGPGSSFGYCLSAFVSASRSVTFLLQKEMAHVDGFPKWWEQQQERLRRDAAARFFLAIRNFSQKEGRISLVGAGNGSGHWTYRFGGNAEKVPPQLLRRDVADCCMEHVAKLADLILNCAEAFPYQTCPQRAATPEGFAYLGLSIGDLLSALGYPPQWMEASSGIPVEEQFKILRREIDGLDVVTIRQLKDFKAEIKEHGPDEEVGREWVDLLVEHLESGGQMDKTQMIRAMLMRQAPKD